METDILAKLNEQEKKISEIYVSVEKTRKYFLWTLIATLALFILPLILLAVVAPLVLNTYLSGIETLGI